MPTFFEIQRPFFVASAIALGLFLLVKISKLKGNNGNKLLYLNSVIALTARELMIIALIITPTGNLPLLLIPFVYSALSAVVVSGLVMTKLRGNNAGQAERYFSIKEDLADLSKYLHENPMQFGGLILWNIAFAYLSFLTVFSPSYRYLAERIRCLLITFSFWYAAYFLHELSYKVPIAQDSAKKVDKIITCYILLGILSVFSLWNESFFLKHFVALQGGLFIFEALSVHYFSTLLHNNERMEFIEFNQIGTV